MRRSGIAVFLTVMILVSLTNVVSAVTSNEIVKSIRARSHFGKMLPNDVEFTNPLQRTMIMYMSSNTTIKQWIELEKLGKGNAAGFIDDNDLELAMTALYVLGKGGKADTPIMRRLETVMYSDNRWVVRNRAVLAAYYLGQTDIVEKAISDPHWNIRLLAVRAIGRTGDFDALMNAIKKETALQAKKPDAVYDWGDGPRYWVLRGAAHELKLNGFSEKLDKIIREDTDLAKRMEAVRALAWMEESGARRSLEAAYNDKDPAVRAAAVWGMGHQNWVNRDQRGMVRMLKDTDASVRRATIDTLLEHWNPLTIENIAPFLEDAELENAYTSAASIMAIVKELKPGESTYDPGKTEEEKRTVIEEAKKFWEKYADKIKEHDLSELDFLAPPDLMDLDMLYVTYTPDYSWGTEKTRPDIDEEITWIGYLENKGTQPTGEFLWSVIVGGKQLYSEKAKSLKPNEQLELKWKAPYKHSNRWMTFSAKSLDGTKEITTYNNSLTFRENSIRAGFWAEDGRRLLYDRIQAYFHSGANSYEDWQQRNLNFWNASMRRSVYLLMPEGSLEHIRAHKIVRLKDGELPLNGGLTGNNPDMKDHTVDVMWGFPGKDIEKKFPFAAAKFGEFPWLEASLHHEMSHARYLVDFYGLNMRGEDCENRLPDGRRMFPPAHDNLYYTEEGIVMKSGYFAGFSEAHACAYGRIVSRPAINGAWNASPNIGEYLSDLPSSVTFRILDTTGKPLQNAVVDIYQSVNDPREWNHRTGFYDRQLYDKSDICGATDSNGVFVVNRQILSGDRISGYLGNTFILLVVRKGNQHDWRFYEVTQFNKAAWTNGFGNAAFSFKTNISTTRLSVPRIISSRRVDNGFEITWTPVARKYEIYVKSGNYDWNLLEAGITKNSYMLPGTERKQYSVVAIDGDIKSARSEPFEVQPRRRPKRVAADVYGDRYFLDNGLMIITPEGSYRGRLDRYARGAVDLDVGLDGTMVFLAPNDKRKVEGKDIELKDRVVVVNSSTYTRWFSSDDELSKLVGPRGVAIAPDGRVYVASTGSQDIVIFDNKGKAIKRFGGSGKTFGKFLKPVDIDIHPRGMVAVADEEQGTVQIFNLDGEFWKMISNLNHPRAVEFDISGHLYIATAEGISVFSCNQASKPALIMTITNFGDEELNDILDIAVTMYNEILIARKDKEKLFTLPPVSGFSVLDLKPDVFFGNMPVAVSCLVRASSEKAQFPRELRVIGEKGKTVATLQPRRGTGAGPNTIRYVGKVRNSDKLVNDGFMIVELKSAGPGIRYAFPRARRKMLDVMTQTSRFRRSSTDQPEKFNLTVVMDNNTSRDMPGEIGIAALPKGVSIVNSKTPGKFVIKRGARKVFDYQVIVGAGEGLFATPVTLNYKFGRQSSSETVLLESPIMWTLFGPIPAEPDEGFKTSYAPEKKIDFTDSFETGGITSKWFDLPPSWFDYRGVVFLDQFMDPSPNMGIYAYTALYSDVDREVLLKFGTDDTITAWLNGKKIISKNSRRGVKVDEDVVPVILKKGINPVLLKVWNGDGGWGFIMRVTDKDGNAVTGLRAAPVQAGN